VKDWEWLGWWLLEVVGSWRLLGGLRYARIAYEARGQETRSQPIFKMKIMGKS